MDPAASAGPALHSDGRLPLLTLLLFLLVVVVIWMFAAPGERYLNGFVALLTEPAITRGPFSFFSGRSYAAGKFQDRKVAISPVESRTHTR